MQIYLIRHTTPNIDRGICYGQTDIDLDQTTFEQELAVIKSKLPADIEQFYTSPLQRCTTLTQRLNPHFVVDNRLMELNFGDWETKNWGEIAPSELDPWMQDFVNIQPPNGENYIDLHKRTTHFLDDVLALDFQRIALTTHAGNIRSILSFVLSLSLEHSFRIQLSYGTVVCVKLDKLASNNKLISIR